MKNCNTCGYAEKFNNSPVCGLFSDDVAGWEHNLEKWVRHVSLAFVEDTQGECGEWIPADDGGFGKADALWEDLSQQKDGQDE